MASFWSNEIWRSISNLEWASWSYVYSWFRHSTQHLVKVLGNLTSLEIARAELFQPRLIIWNASRYPLWYIGLFTESTADTLRWCTPCVSRKLHPSENSDDECSSEIFDLNTVEYKYRIHKRHGTVYALGAKFSTSEWGVYCMWMLSAARIGFLW